MVQFIIERDTLIAYEAIYAYAGTKGALVMSDEEWNAYQAAQDQWQVWQDKFKALMKKE